VKTLPAEKLEKLLAIGDENGDGNVVGAGVRVGGFCHFRCSTKEVV